MAERVHLFTTPNSLHATPNPFHATPNSLHASPHFSNSEFTSRNSEFISRNSEFTSRNLVINSFKFMVIISGLVSISLVNKIKVIYLSKQSKLNERAWPK